MTTETEFLTARGLWRHRLFFQIHFFSFWAKKTGRRRDIFVILSWFPFVFWQSWIELLLPFQLFDFFYFDLSHFFLWSPGSFVIFWGEGLLINRVGSLGQWSQHSIISNRLYDRPLRHLCLKCIGCDIYWRSLGSNVISRSNEVNWGQIKVKYESFLYGVYFYRQFSRDYFHTHLCCQDYR